MKTYIQQVEEQLDFAPNLPLQFSQIVKLESVANKKFHFIAEVESDFYDTSKMQTFPFYKYISKIF